MWFPMVGANYRGVNSNNKRRGGTRPDHARPRMVTQEDMQVHAPRGGGKTLRRVLQREFLAYGV